MPTLKKARLMAGLGSLADIDWWMGRHHQRTLCPNTKVHRRQNGGFGYTLHNNVIATFLPDDSVSISFCGWRTVTTKSRLNLIAGVRAHKDGGLWFVNGVQVWPRPRVWPWDFVAFRNDFVPYRTEAVCGIARKILEEGRPDISPVLADALDDAGCAHQRVQEVLRSGQPNDVVEKILAA